MELIKVCCFVEPACCPAPAPLPLCWSQTATETNNSHSTHHFVILSLLLQDPEPAVLRRSVRACRTGPCLSSEVLTERGTPLFGHGGT